MKFLNALSIQRIDLENQPAGVLSARESGEVMVRVGLRRVRWTLLFFWTSCAAHRADDELLRLHDEEEHEAAEEKPGPDPERNGFGMEQRLQRRCIREQELQNHDGADAETQVLVSGVRLERQ